jgi:hypothetical protein
MAFKMKYKNLEEVVAGLRTASKSHAKQADIVEKHVNKIKDGKPFKKISASCKAQAKKKFKVWPSAYASGWGVRCTRGDFKKK